MPIEIREINIRATVDDASKSQAADLNAEQIEEIIQETLERLLQIRNNEAI